LRLTEGDGRDGAEVHAAVTLAELVLEYEIACAALAEAQPEAGYVVIPGDVVCLAGR